MSKVYKLRLIKTRESYTTKRISQELGVHTRTVQDWIKGGLQPIENKRPYLVMGYELKRFLELKLQKHKCRLEPDQFYCTKCRHAVKPMNNDIWLDISTESIGKDGFMAMTIKGICKNCNSRINRFSHTGKVEQIKEIFNVVEIKEKK